MLQDRLDVGIKLCKAGAAPKLCCRGDHGQVRYDEVNVMKEYAAWSRVCPRKTFFSTMPGSLPMIPSIGQGGVPGGKDDRSMTQGYQYRRPYTGVKMGIVPEVRLQMN